MRGAILTIAVGLALAVGTALPTPALAFCGFFVSGADAKLNNASQVALYAGPAHAVSTPSNWGPWKTSPWWCPLPVIAPEGDGQDAPA
ncbi:MAG: hypothetical protein R3F43_01040 [bacterium]